MRFITGVPFTKAQLEIATERWQEPLGDDDWKDIAKGTYMYEKREQALQQYQLTWARDNPERKAKLKGDVFGRDERGPWPAVLTRGERESKWRG